MTDEEYKAHRQRIADKGDVTKETLGNEVEHSKVWLDIGINNCIAGRIRIKLF